MFEKSVAVSQIILSLEVEPEKWTQTQYTLNHEKDVRIWTSGLSFMDIKVYYPIRWVGIIDKVRLQLAVNRWHKNVKIFT